mgnify:CR=1 FL=1
MDNGVKRILKPRVCGWIFLRNEFEPFLEHFPSFVAGSHTYTLVFRDATIVPEAIVFKDGRVYKGVPRRRREKLPLLGRIFFRPRVFPDHG